MRGARGIRILAGIESIAAAPARRRWRAWRFLDDWRWGSNLLVVPRLWLPIGRIRLRRYRGDVGLDGGGLTAGSGLRASLKHPQAIFELAVTVLQLFILAGELPQLILKLLNPHFRIDVVGLRVRLRR
jgi:hypothetical protein